MCCFSRLRLFEGLRSLHTMSAEQRRSVPACGPDSALLMIASWKHGDICNIFRVDVFLFHPLLREKVLIFYQVTLQ